MIELPYNPDAEAFFAGLANGAVLMQKCADCGRVQFPSRVRCLACGADAPELMPIDGAGTVYAKTVNRRAPEEAFAALVPYAVALIDLDVGVRVIARADCPPDQVHTGGRVEVFADPAPPLLPGLVFRPVSARG
jgi:uncharacterized OB-fold protein